MPNYRRLYLPGNPIFLTLVTYNRAPVFRDNVNVALLRCAVKKIKEDQPFEIIAAAIMPDHIHFVWNLPNNDGNYSKRVGRIKVLFTKAFLSQSTPTESASLSRQKHRERDVWQRRFWERTIRSEIELSRCLDYIHYNPVKHGLVKCPHLWPHSSFQKWVTRGHYSYTWACHC